MRKMKYGGFTWSNNPSECSLQCEKAYAVHKYPGYSTVDLEDFGGNAIVLSGSGEFFGKNAYTNYKKLEKEFNKKGVRSFYHPIYTTMKYGLMTKLNSNLEPRENYMAYTFEMVVCKSINNVKPYTLSSGVSGPRVYATTTYGSGGSGSGSSGGGSGKSDTDDDDKVKFDVGDIIVVNGAVYYDPDGKQFASYSRDLKTTVTEVRGNSNCPIHFGTYGWTSEGSCTKYSGSSSSSKSDGSTVVYTVKSGDTLSEICARYGADWRTVASANGIKDARDIRKGQKITITR